MRVSPLLIVLASTSALAQELEIFVDRNETYVRGGADQGLQRGTSLDVIAGKGGKKIGVATVMETWPALARVNLDDPARADKAPKKYAVLQGAAAQPTPPPPPPTAAPEAKRRVAGADVAPPPPPPPPQQVALKGRAVYGGAGPWTAAQVINESHLDWHDCLVTLMPMRASYKLAFLRAEDHELIARSNFSNNDFSGDPTSVRVVCTEGSADFPIK